MRSPGEAPDDDCHHQTAAGLGDHRGVCAGDHAFLRRRRIDRLLPLVTLREAHTEVDVGDMPKRYHLYYGFHAFAGYALRRPW